MKSYILVFAFVSAAITDTSAFGPAFLGQRVLPTPHVSFVQTRRSLAMLMADVQSPAYEIEATPNVHSESRILAARDTSSSTHSALPRIESKPKMDQNHKQGILSPVVLAAKQALGEEKLNKLRAQVISMHSDVIKGFVDTAETTEVGKAVLKALFNVADENHNGKIEEEELAHALQALGFEWLQEKQIHGIFDRADVDHNGAIDVEEWLREAPRTLRTNLVKLAKKNGGELGLLV